MVAALTFEGPDAAKFDSLLLKTRRTSARTNELLRLVLLLSIVMIIENDRSPRLLFVSPNSSRAIFAPGDERIAQVSVRNGLDVTLSKRFFPVSPLRIEFNGSTRTV